MLASGLNLTASGRKQTSALRGNLARCYSPLSTQSGHFGPKQWGGMDAKIALDHRAVIERKGAILRVFRPDGRAAFEFTAPEGGAFYLFAEHVVHGQWPIVSFD